MVYINTFTYTHLYTHLFSMSENKKLHVSFHIDHRKRITKVVCDDKCRSLHHECRAKQLTVKQYNETTYVFNMNNYPIKERPGSHQNIIRLLIHTISVKSATHLGIHHTSDVIIRVCDRIIFNKTHTYWTSSFIRCHHLTHTICFDRVAISENRS